MGELRPSQLHPSPPPPPSPPPYDAPVSREDIERSAPDFLLAEGYEDYRGIMDLENNNPSVEDIEDEDYQYSDDMPSKDSNDNYLIDYDAWVSNEEGVPTADNDAVHIQG